LNRAAPEARKSPQESMAGGVSNWALTDALWAELSRDTPDNPMPLSGEAASLLLSARQAATSTTQSARGQAARFNELLSAYQSERRLTGFELYWQTIVDSLSNKPMTVLDPKASGHKRLFLGGPDELRTGALVREAEAAAANSRPPARELAPDQAPADRAAPERGEEPEQDR